MAVAVAAPRRPLARLRTVIWRQPQWPWALLAAAAWVVTVVTMADGHDAAATDHTTHAHGAMHPAPANHDDAMTLGLGDWAVMSAAMMLPAALPILRELGASGLWRRRYRGPAMFVASYLGVWLAAGAVTLAAWALLHLDGVSGDVAGGAALLAAAAWGLTRSKHYAIARCHRFLPAPAAGRAADVGCLRFGGYHGAQCVIACLPLMVAMVPTHGIALMIGATAVTSWERRARRPRLRLTALITAFAGLALIVAALA